MFLNWTEWLAGTGSWILWAASEPTWLDGLLVVVKVVVGLCMVIFVHELGHFLVAKLNGVWCEKFYLGFDFFGLRLLRFRWGETEYGIGLFPLGGYVKMLGQEDNPGRLQEELQRAKSAQTASSTAPSSSVQISQATDITQTAQNAQSGETTADRQPAQPTPEDSHPAGGTPEEVAALEAALYHPRSYLAKSVPQRMAIIAAGVGMNVVFAFLAAIWALGLGVEDIRCGLGEVVPGQPAWQKNLQPGDRILAIGGRKVDRFQQLRTDISLGDLSEGVELLVERPGVPAPWTVHVYPERRGKYPTIGVGVPWSNQLMRELAAIPGTAAAQAQPPLMPGDRIVQVNSTPVSNYGELRRALAQVPDQPILLHVRRVPTALASSEALSTAIPPGPNDAQTPAPSGAGETEARSKSSDGLASSEEEVVVRVGPQPIRRLGLILEMGPLVAIQDDSPAQRAGLLPGDVLSTVDDQPVGDPLTLPERLRRRSQEQPQTPVRIGLLRQGRRIEFSVLLRQADFYYESFVPESPVAVPALGVAYSVRNQVVGVVPGSPADQAGILPGSLLVAAQVFPPEEVEDARLTPAQIRQAQKMLGFQIKATLGDKPNWPYLISRLQNTLPGSTVELQFQYPQGEENSVRLSPAPSTESFNPLRGLLLEPEVFTRKAASVSESIRMGYQETVDSLTMIFRMLRALGSGQVSATELRGPIGIIDVAVQFASAGTGDFLLFLCILSANLAVLNVLPIPVLDGGHLLFLAYEGIRGKPPSERVLITLTYLGLFFILGLVLWVTGLDIGRWFAGN